MAVEAWFMIFILVLAGVGLHRCEKYDLEYIEKYRKEIIVTGTVTAVEKVETLPASHLNYAESTRVLTIQTPIKEIKINSKVGKLGYQVNVHTYIDTKTNSTRFSSRWQPWVESCYE
jgi:hypothetical protein